MPNSGKLGIPENKVNHSFIIQGEIKVGYSPTVFSTIVGSCIAVCVWDKRLKLGGICHFYLPNAPADDISSHYGNVAIVKMLRIMKQKGTKRSDLEAKILGGGHVIESDQTSFAGGDIGQQNIAIAMSILKQYGVRILAKEVGGTHGRNIRFETESGKVLFKEVTKNKLENRKIKVLILDQSKSSKNLIKCAVENNPRFQLIGKPKHPAEAVTLIKRDRPSVVIVDVENGKRQKTDFLRGYLSKVKIPTVIVSTADNKNLLETLDCDSFHYFQVNPFMDMSSLADMLRESLLVATNTYRNHAYNRNLQDPILTKGFGARELENTIIAIGASTGGTVAIRTVLSKLPNKFPPIVIALHIPGGFSKDFAVSLDSLFPFRVCEASGGEIIEPNTVYLAPGGRHLRLVDSPAKKIYTKVTDDPPVNGFRPSVDYLFESLTKIKNKKIIAKNAS